jgi:hypothetical protein
MRALNIDDAFAFSEIIDKMGIDTDINDLMDKGREKGQEWVGGQLVLLILKKMHKAKKELIGLLASVAEIEPSELEKKPIVYLKDVFQQITQDPQFADFFQSAGNEQK